MPDDVLEKTKPTPAPAAAPPPQFCGEEIIAAGNWANCFWCEKILNELKLCCTFCHHCRNATCSLHGNFRGRVFICCGDMVGGKVPTQQFSSLKPF